MRANRTGSSAKIGARLNLVSKLDEAEGYISEGDGRKGVQSVDIALAIVRVLERSRGALTLTQIGQSMSEPASKMHHYLVSLIRNGLVTQKEDGRYDLGLYAIQLGLAAL